jgi:hypothetical protein
MEQLFGIRHSFCQTRQPGRVVKRLQSTSAGLNAFQRRIAPARLNATSQAQTIYALD